MQLGKRYGELFQMSYITRDLDAAIEHARTELKVEGFHTTEAELDVLSYGKIKPLKLRAAYTNIGRHQFELIQPVSGAIEVYTEHVDLARHIVNFHHVAIAVRGTLTDWLALVEEVKASGDQFAFLAPPEPTGDDKVCFGYVDTRKRLGHFTEYLWVDESIKPIPAMPDLDA